MKQCWQITIQGKVQGVWYRASTQRQARNLGLVGYVQNELDGSVYAVAQGDSKSLQALVCVVALTVGLIVLTLSHAD